MVVADIFIYLPPSLMNMSSRTQLRPQLTAQLVLFQPDLIKYNADRQSTGPSPVRRETEPRALPSNNAGKITYFLLASIINSLMAKVTTSSSLFSLSSLELTHFCFCFSESHRFTGPGSSYRPGLRCVE